MAIYLRNDVYVTTVYGSGSSNCYVTCYYNQGRNGNAATYSGWTGVRMGEPGAWYNDVWWIAVRCDGVTVFNGIVKYKTSGSLGTTYYGGSWSYSRNTNYDGTGVYMDWYDTGWSTSAGAARDWNLNNYYCGTMSPLGPSAPSRPGTPTYSSYRLSPDSSVRVSWRGSSGGTNGVSGYHVRYSRNGGVNWYDFPNGTTTGSTSYTANLNNLGFNQNDTFQFAVRSYTIVNGQYFYSDWSFSAATKVVFYAPDACRNVSLTYNNEEPIPTAEYVGHYTKPSYTGTNGINRYHYQFYKNNVSEILNEGYAGDLSESLSTTYTPPEGQIEPGEYIYFRVRACTLGHGVEYYGPWTSSEGILVVPDKFIFLSENGGDFEKRKMYISENGGDFKEVKKNKFKIIV